MKALIIYESHWGNTAAIAKAIAEGIGTEAQALTTAHATMEMATQADLVVAGAPLIAFHLPTQDMLKSMEMNQSRDPQNPDLSHPTLRSWLEQLPKGSGRAAAFETRLWWSPGSATKTIEELLVRAGYHILFKGERFIVKGRYGPLRGGELERAQRWGVELRKMH
jgi:flavorubredoxin